MTESENIKAFFLQYNREYEGQKINLLNVKGIEKLARIPSERLKHFLNRKYSKLTDTDIHNLVTVLELLGYEPVTSDHQYL